MTISLIAKGAEACLYLEKWYEFTVVRKHRIPKKYRLASLDQPLRRERTIREARMLNAARRAGVRTPVVFSVVPEEATIIMEYIQGDRLKESLPTFTSARRNRLFQKIGSAIARLHQHNLSHGDLTTSNMLLHPNYQVYFIDFGLVLNNDKTPRLAVARRWCQTPGIPPVPHPCRHQLHGLSRETGLCQLRVL